MEIRFESASARKDFDGNNCDNCFLCYNPCDPYVTVSIDGVRKFRSDTVWDNESPNFNAIFTSERISKDSHIDIEMWDDDAGDTGDDLMSRWVQLHFNSREMHRNLQDRQNYVNIFAKWK